MSENLKLYKTVYSVNNGDNDMEQLGNMNEQ